MIFFVNWHVMCSVQNEYFQDFWVFVHLNRFEQFAGSGFIEARAVLVQIYLLLSRA